MITTPVGGRYAHNGHGTPNILDGSMREFMSNIATAREAFGQLFGTDTRRDLFAECRYPRTIRPEDYRFMYERNGAATRVVDIYPDECFALDPVIYESEDASETTDFERAWNELTSTSEEEEDVEESGSINVMSYLHRLDQVSGIGRYGVMFLGLDDGRGFDKAVPGIGEDGRPRGRQRKHKLLYLRVFDETQATIKTRQKTPGPRFGLPLTYNINFEDPAQEGGIGVGTGTTNVEVHWSRIIHAADDRKSNEVFGTPRMKSVYNWLLDFQKIIGGSGEMFWRGGFPGLFVESDPALGAVTLNKEKLMEEIANQQEGLQRAVALTGMTAKQLAPAIANPAYHIRGVLSAIAMSKGVPTRIFLGSEEAKLSSTQDGLTWNKRLRRRQLRYLTPDLFRPFIKRLIMYGVLPRPQRFKVDWPDLNTLTDEEKATVAQKRAQALATYVSGNVEAVMEFKHFLTEVMGFTMEQAKIILAAAKKQVRLTEDPADVAMRQAMLKVTAAATNKTATPGRGGKTTGAATKPRVAKAKARPVSRPK